ncbi:MAG: hypothetical protein F4Y40_09315 [Acidimicrobiia bacterium]|nr:hypothetical protein [Acidimicrobiia bacterium]
MADNPTQTSAEGSGLVSGPREASEPGSHEASGSARPGIRSGVQPVRTSGDRMAMAGLVCSLCVVPVTLLIIPVANMPSTNDAAGGIFVLLMLAGAALWVSGLVLSLRAKNRASRHHKLARAGTIISGITPMLFLAVLLLLLIQAVDWFFNDFFLVGVPTGGQV